MSASGGDPEPKSNVGLPELDSDSDRARCDKHKNYGNGPAT